MVTLRATDHPQHSRRRTKQLAPQGKLRGEVLGEGGVAGGPARQRAVTVVAHHLMGCERVSGVCTRPDQTQVMSVGTAVSARASVDNRRHDIAQLQVQAPSRTCNESKEEGYRSTRSGLLMRARNPSLF